MPASISGAAPNPALPSRSRSREGRSRARSSKGLPAWFIEHARRLLHQQRAFRVDQLRRLATSSPTVSDPAREEIDATLRDAARSVVTLVDAALLRIDQGTYGRCHRCGDLMSLNRLAVLPMSTLCGRCQRTMTLTWPEPVWGAEQRRDVARDV